MGLAAQQSEQRIEAACERLQRSREQLFALAHGLVGNPPADGEHGLFPRSRLMRALTGNGGRVLLGGAALAATMLRPSLLWRVTKVAGLLRPVLLRYVLPRLLR
jgi:hypothetical protein